MTTTTELWPPPPTSDHPESGDLVIAAALMTYYGWTSQRAGAFVDGVHAAERASERAATVQRIKHAIGEQIGHRLSVPMLDAIVEILEKEAAR